MTATRQYSEETILETITTRLPVTYESNILLVVLAILITAIIVVLVTIKIVKEKQTK